MAKENLSCLWPLAIIVVVVGIYYGFFKPKKGATLEDVATGRGLEVSARCITKEVNGLYSLSIVTEKATYRPWEKQKLEYRYEFNLIKDGCFVSDVNAKRLGSTTLDTTTTTLKRSPLNKRDTADITVVGDIESDTLSLEIRVKTDNPQDCKILVKFSFPHEKIQILDGIFVGSNCGLLSGTARLKKK